METKINHEDQGRKLLAVHWELNANDYRNNFSFHWRQNPVRIEVQSYSKPPYKDRYVYFTFYINDKPYHYKWGYNCYGGSHWGEIPSISTENTFWIRKSLHYQYSADIFLHKYIIYKMM